MGWSIRFREFQAGGAGKRSLSSSHIAETMSSKSQPAKHLMSTRPGIAKLMRPRRFLP